MLTKQEEEAKEKQNILNSHLEEEKKNSQSYRSHSNAISERMGLLGKRMEELETQLEVERSRFAFFYIEISSLKLSIQIHSPY